MNRKFTVMVAEDEELVLRSFCNNLHAVTSEFQVVATASNGAEMLKLVTENPPDILFTDIQMPIKSGLELLADLDELCPQTIRIIISGYDDFQFAREALRLHAEDYLLKPVLKEDIVQVLQRMKSKYLDARPCQEAEVPQGILQAMEILQQHIQTHFQEELDIGELAQKLHYNELHLRRSFKQAYGISPQKMITNLRMEHAKNLLETQPQLTVGDIGLQVGYSSPMYFSRVFKLYTGKTPGEYRTYVCLSCQGEP